MRLPSQLISVRLLGCRDDRDANSPTGIAIDDITVSDCQTFSEYHVILLSLVQDA